MCEDDEDELRRRRNQIAHSLNLQRADVDGRLHLVPRVGDENALMDFPHGLARRTGLFERIIGEARRLRIKLLILDNAAQLFAGNENDRAQVTAFLNAVAAIARQLQCAVLILGHPPKAPGIEFSGSTAWDAVVRSRIWFKRIKDAEGNDCDDRYSLELVKSNYAKRFGIEIALNGAGVAEYVCDLESGAKRKKTNDEHTLDVLAELYTRHRRSVTLDEIVVECIRRGMFKEAELNTAQWRDRRRSVRSHLAKHTHRIDERENDAFAMKP